MSSQGTQNGSADLQDVIHWLASELERLHQTSDRLQHAIADAEAHEIDPVRLQSLDLLTQTADNLSHCAKILAQQSRTPTIDLDPLLKTLTLGELKQRLSSAAGIELGTATQAAETGHVDLF